MPRPAPLTRSLIKLLLAWSLALFALLASLQPASADPSGDPITSARAALTAAEAQISQRLHDRAELEARYQAGLDLIQRLKAQRGALDPLGARDLRAALGDARALAEQLNALTTQLNAARQSALDAQSTLLALYDAQLATAEQALLRAAPADQPPLLAQLNTLQRDRARLRASLPALQTPYLPPIPQLATLASSDPDELLAAAGELKDHEARLRAQLTAVESRLTRLEKQRKISNLADDFLDEDATFSEDQATIRLSAARSTSAASNTAAGGAAKTDTSGGSTGGSTGGDAAAPSGGRGDTPSGSLSSNDPTGGSSSGGGMDASPPGGLQEDFASAPEVSVGDPTTLPAMPDITPPPPLDPSGPPSYPAGPDAIIRSDTDPSVILRGSTPTTYSLSSPDELRSLRSQRRQLLDHLRDVRAQEEALRQRAEQLGGF